ncbi:hypothetical protein BIV59_06445 [Bacillus sp. MUM 13]|nr:hypothetical protein BIV59_06445 [Bacillus sp. MUM 13]
MYHCQAKGYTEKTMKNKREEYKQLKFYLKDSSLCCFPYLKISKYKKCVKKLDMLLKAWFIGLSI